MTTGAAASSALADGQARLGILLGLALGLSAAPSLWRGAGLILARPLRTDRQ